MAYTKYSLTPANNNAAPPDGAPEGMLPSAVNDTMRDMMAQIRDCGDGIRGGTYTMTAPVITGGSIDGAAIGASTASTGAFTTLSVSSTVSGTGFSNYFASPPALGGTAAAAVSSTNLSYTGTLTGGTGVVNLGSGQFYKDASGNVSVGSTGNPFTARIYSQETSATEKNNIAIYTTGAHNTSRIALYNDAGSASVQSILGSLSFSSGGVGSSNERMRIDSSGNVGIGVSSPVDKLQVEGNIYLGTTGRTIYQSGSANLTLQVNTGNTIFLRSNGVSESMRIDSSGNVGIGNTTTTFQVSATGINMLSTGGGGGAGQWSLGIGHPTGTPNGGAYVVFGYNSGVIGSIAQNGTTAVAYNTSSDYRLKENIAPMTGALDVVQQLKPVTYNWKVDGSNGQGFIAHELQAVVPDCVTGEKDAVDEKGNPVYQGIDTSFLVATLTAAIQELNAKIEAQALEIQALKAK